MRTLLIAPSAAEPSLPIVRARSRAEAEGYLESIPMEPRERVLYHQIHPLKLGGDITAALVSLPLIWRGRRGLGMVVHWATPIVASAVVLPRTAELERLRGSRAGRYVNHEMTPPMQATRFIGDAISVAGAWHRRADWIVLGGLVVVAGWTLGPGGLLWPAGPGLARRRTPRSAT